MARLLAWVDAHLGNGVSLCALAADPSIDTTMSFTALDGLAMGTRCGEIDPGVILFMLLGTQDSRLDIRVIPTNEEAMIIAHTRDLLRLA